MGGPVVFPHLYNGHNKTFFYGAYEGWRHPAQTTLERSGSQHPDEEGDFSKYTDGSWTFTGLRDPYTGAQLRHDASFGAISQIAANTLKQFYPDPNIGDPTAYTDNGVANYQENVDDSGHSNQFDLRGDQYFGSNQKFLLWGRFTWKNFPTSTPEILTRAFGVEQQPEPCAQGRYQLEHQTQPDQRRRLWIYPLHLGETNSFDGLAWTNSQGWQGLQNLFYNGIPEMDFNHIQQPECRPPDRSEQVDHLRIQRHADLDKGQPHVQIRRRHPAAGSDHAAGLQRLRQLRHLPVQHASAARAVHRCGFRRLPARLPDQTFYDVVSRTTTASRPTTSSSGRTSGA